MKILVKRIYEPADKSDGFRVLVDRLWPRGMSKQNASSISGCPISVLRRPCGVGSIMIRPSGRNFVSATMPS